MPERCDGHLKCSSIAPSLGGVLILLASTIAAIAEPLPVRKVGDCPAGYVSGPAWCTPMRGTRRDAIVKVRRCPANWTESGNYCLSPQQSPQCREMMKNNTAPRRIPSFRMNGMGLSTMTFSHFSHQSFLLGGFISVRSRNVITSGKAGSWVTTPLLR